MTLMQVHLASLSYFTKLASIFAEVLDLSERRTSNSAKHEYTSNQGMINGLETFSGLKDVLPRNLVVKAIFLSEQWQEFSMVD